MARLSVKEYEQILNKKNISKKEWEWIDKKYNAKSIMYNNIKFRSTLEYKRYIFLELLVKIWQIKEFKYEPIKFILQEKFKFNNKTYPKITYTPDFRIELNNWEIWYEDTKSEITRKKESYRIKMKLFVFKYIVNWKEKIDWFMEVFKSNEIYWK